VVNKLATRKSAGQGSWVKGVAYPGDEDSRQLRFVDVVTSGLLGLERKHHLLPVEAVSEEGPGSIALEVDQQSVQSAPPFPNPHVGPDEEYQHTIREHYGYG
jgi:hypothetical protein